MIGGSCFALASTPFASSTVPIALLGWTYVIGAVFFTSASFVQLTLEGNRSRLKRATGPRDAVRIRLLTAAAGYAWLACLVQFVGTIAFNVDTIRALDTSLTTTQELLLVWRPEAIGSACFLVASVLAYGAFTGTGTRVLHDWRSGDWWIAGWNLLGSVLFGVSTIAGYFVPSTGEPINAALMNTSTMLGALCFVWGAWLARPRDT